MNLTTIETVINILESRTELVKPSVKNVMVTLWTTLLIDSVPVTVAPYPFSFVAIDLSVAGRNARVKLITDSTENITIS